jgi:uroporphyrinogen decarboxylase
LLEVHGFTFPEEELMLNRRNFLYTAAATAGLALAKPVFAKKVAAATLTHKERVDRALRGEDLDRPPFTFYHHYKRPTPQLEAQDHLEFHRTFNTDIVKVMNDFDYPKSATGKWHELKALDSPFPEQLTTLKIVRDGLNGDAYFIDTIYGPYMTAMILFRAQPEYSGVGKSEEAGDKVLGAIHDFQKEHPDQWHTALEAITQSTLNHIRQIKDIGASGALVGIFNAASKFGSVSDYEQYSRPYDKRVFDALADTRLTFLHLHNLERPYISQFKDLDAPVIQYSLKTSGIPVSEIRGQFAQTIAGGVDEVDYEKLTVSEIHKQWTKAREQAGAKYIAAPGCSVPNASTPEELARFPRALGI